MQEALERCGRELTEPAVHALRLAARHLAPVVEVFHALDPDNRRSRRLREHLRRILDLTGALRDIQLRRIHLEATVGDGSLRNALLARTDREERKEERKVRKELDRLALERKVQRGLRALGPIADTDAELVLRATLEKGRQRLHRRILKLRADRPRTLHRVRVAVKRHRYLLESFALHLPPVHTTHRRTLKRLQERLGHWHDEWILAEWLLAGQKDLRPILRARSVTLTTERMAWCEAEQRRLARALAGLKR